MNLSIGIVGLPNIGKSTLFKALTKKEIDIANYPFCTIEPNTGVVEVPDNRIEKLSKFSNSEKTIRAFVKFIDIAGLVKGASQGEGLGNQFLSHIREVNAICHLVRCFEDDDITHVHGKIDPKEDIDIINTELILADLKTIEGTFPKVEKLAKGQDKEAIKNLEVLKKIKTTLSQNTLLKNLKLEKEEQKYLKGLNLLTTKPTIYAGNVSEEKISQEDSILNNTYDLPSPSLFISAQIESELIELKDEERKVYLKDLNLKESGLNKLIRKSYETLGLITFFTTGPKETKAWTIPKNTPAPQAAGQIHSDIERGFIAAETITWKDLLESGSYPDAIAQGKVKTKGKEYIIEDGDTIEFKFNV